MKPYNIKENDLWILLSQVLNSPSPISSLVQGFGINHVTPDSLHWQASVSKYDHLLSLFMYQNLICIVGKF